MARNRDLQNLSRGLDQATNIVRQAGVLLRLARGIANMFRRRSKRRCPRTGRRLHG